MSQLTTAEAAKILGIAEATLNEWRIRGEGPASPDEEIRYLRAAALESIDLADVATIMLSQGPSAR